MEYVKLYKGKHYHKKRTKKQNIKNKNRKVIVFDFDETIGSFSELKMLWLFIKENIIIDSNDTQTLLNEILDLYPEFLRYGILYIFKYLHIKKMEKECSNIYIYTNNQCSSYWVTFISNYINNKVNNEEEKNIFDKIIYAFKINNIQIEMNRTTSMKTYGDFINCTLLPESTEICFIDNSYYPKMKNEKVYYIQPIAYNHKLTLETIISRFLSYDLYKKYNFTYDSLYKWFFMNRTYNIREIVSLKTDIYVTQRLMYYLQDFLSFPHNGDKTLKRRQMKLNSTLKNKIL